MPPSPRQTGWRWAIVPLAVIAAFWLAGRLAWLNATMLPQVRWTLINLASCRLVYQGRVKPFDTLARNSLRVISDIETFKGILPASELDVAWPKIEQELKDKYPAIQSEDLSAFETGDTNGLIQRIVDKTQGDTYAITRRS